MAIHFQTNDPDKLLASFKDSIDKGRVVTWVYDKDGDFTHTTDQWKNAAWLRPIAKNGELIFSIIKPQSRNISAEVYAIYHGRFIESMLVHCDLLFNRVFATALPSDDDHVS